MTYYFKKIAASNYGLPINKSEPILQTKKGLKDKKNFSLIIDIATGEILLSLERGNEVWYIEKKQLELFVKSGEIIQDSTKFGLLQYINNRGDDIVSYGAKRIGLLYYEFVELAGTIYAEMSNANECTYDEAFGIMNVIKNRLNLYINWINNPKRIGFEESKKLDDLFKIIKDTGIYGNTLKREFKTNSGDLKDYSWKNIFFEHNEVKIKQSLRAVLNGLITQYDNTNGATFWHGKDFHIKSEPAYGTYYLHGFHFTDKKHDNWKMGDYMVVETNFVKTPYRYESTAFFGTTTFMKGPDDFRIKRGRYLDSGNPIKSDINDKSYLKYEPIGWW